MADQILTLHIGEAAYLWSGTWNVKPNLNFTIQP
ncbi:hypothetical protein BT1A1_2989 [Caldibacillus thermoamylovorans]|uniref:Uncharacterized protein n=1 Tax=Caldibacillus thermoamylovorans TaxID=35841 RepID=A0A090J2A0_9BACI|nr:hypothetical protein BT1A1_2989 [Caldibacillus thermoamylovorans]